MCEKLNQSQSDKLTAICAFGLFADDNQDIDFDKIEIELSQLSKQCEQHSLDECESSN